jgi:hypothetical protein
MANSPGLTLPLIATPAGTTTGICRELFPVLPEPEVTEFFDFMAINCYQH